MALLQISEPNSSFNKKHKVSIGIDLGTTNSLVAIVKNDKAVCLTDENNNDSFPSVVRFLSNNDIIVGKDALINQNIDPKNTISSIKRLLGKNIDDINRLFLPYDFNKNSNLIEIKTCQGYKNAIEISAYILKYLKFIAQNNLKEEIKDAVITVPAYFNESQRQATKDAANIAGLNVLRLINEPTAAALAYGIDNNSQGIFLVYDLGGGTFDISVLNLSEGLFKVIVTGGDNNLGGNDFDILLCDFIKQKLNLNIENEKDNQILLTKSKEIKELLTSNDFIQTLISIQNKVINFEISLSEFEKIIEPLAKKTIELIIDLLNQNNINKDSIDGIIMVGGSTKMKIIQRKVKNLFNKELLNNLDPDKVVAIGAAMQANILIGNKSKNDWLLVDVVPLSLGIETYGGLVEKIILRNSALPITKAQDFTTFIDGQTSIIIHVLQGERDLVEDCRSIAKFVLKGIPPMAAGSARIRVTFQVDTDGILSVFAVEKTTGVNASVEVKPSYGLNEQQIVKMLKDSINNSQHDVYNRNLKESIVNAQSLINHTNSAIKVDKDLLSEDELTNIKNLVNELEFKLKSNDINQINNAIKLLSDNTQKFANLRMDKAIKKALKGKKI